MEIFACEQYKFVISKEYDDSFGGGAIPADVIERLKDEILDVFCGFTEYKDARGAWKGVGSTNVVERCDEANCVLTIDVMKACQAINTMIVASIASRMCEDLKQHVIYVTRHDCDVMHIRRKNDPSNAGADSYMFLIDKTGNIVEHGKLTDKVSDQVLEQDDCLFVLRRELVERYELDQLPSAGRNTTFSETVIEETPDKP